MEKKRCTNFSAIEINLLKDIVLSKAHIIENKKSDASTWKAKKNCWEEISVEFNSRSLNSKSAETLRKKWDNMKKSVKDKVTGQRKYALGTGGGPSMPPPNLTKEEEGIFNLISVQAAGTEPVCDSDYQPDTPVQLPSQAIILTDITVDMTNNEKENMNVCEVMLQEVVNIIILNTNLFLIFFTPPPHLFTDKILFYCFQSIYLENDLQEDELNKWSDYTPKTLRAKPSLKLVTDDDKDNPFRRYRKRNHTGQLTNKAWTELANEKKEICKMKKEHIKALIAESESRKRYYDLQNQLLELELAKKKKEDST